MDANSRLSILYDGLIYRTQVAGGVNRYFANLIRLLPETVDPTLVVGQTREVNYPAHPNLRILKQKTLGPSPASYIIARSFERFWFKATTDYTRRRFDLVHPTYHFLLAEKSLTNFGCPAVITIYDMIHELYPEADFFGAHAREKRKAVMTAQAVICISENTKKDLLEKYAIPESKVTVTHLATEMDASLSYGPEAVPERPYYLYVGKRGGYKNFGGLLTAFAKVISLRSEVALCVIGQPFDKSERRRIAELNLTSRIEHYGYADDRHLAKLYRCSIGLVYPSLYEGFGIPPLEAMSCGTAVIASRSSSIPEVVGDAGLLFDHKSNDELATMMIHLFDDSTARNALIAKGAKRAKLFSWDKTVAQTFAVYRSVSG